jgi:DNA repair protein RadC
VAGFSLVTPTIFGSSSIRLKISPCIGSLLSALRLSASEPLLSETRTIRTPSDAVVVVREAIGDYDREAFVVLLLITKRRVIGVHIAGVATLDSAPTGPREAFRAAILAGAKAVIFGHDHLSGDPTPSAADLHLTRRLAGC